MEERQQMKNSEKLGKMPVGKLLAIMSLPAIFSMLVQSLYNVVDTIFVSRITTENDYALTALGYAFPMQMLTMAVALGIGIGTNSVVARRLGAGDNVGASRIAQTGVKLAVICALVFATLGYFLVKGFVSIYDTGNPEIAQMTEQYLLIVVLLCFGQFVEITVNKILQSTGNMLVPMVSQLIGAITNIVLDPILIFGLLGAPKMGVAGAAVATVIGQWFAMIYTLVMVKVKKSDVKIFFRDLKLKKDDVTEIVKIGAPAFATNAVGAFVTMAMNGILQSYSSEQAPETGTTAVAVLSVYFKLQSFVFMPLFGLTQGAMPILGYNYGARIKKRFYHALKLTQTISVSIMLLGILLFQVCPELLMQIFNSTEGLTEMGVTALRTISFSFLPAAFGIVFSVMYQAIGDGLKALLMPLCRQVILLLPIALLFRLISSAVSLVWLSYPIAELLSASIFVPLGIVTVKKAFARFERERSE